MSDWKIYEDFQTTFHENKSYIFQTLKLLLVVLFAAYAFYRFWIWRTFVKNLNKVASLKLRFYHVFGHATHSIYWRLRKLPLPAHIYDFIILNGVCVVHNKESMMNSWVVNSPFLLVYKADSVEMILNHSTELKKAWYYDQIESWIGNGLLTSDGAKWKSRRKLLTLSFHFNILKDFLPVFNKQSKVLVDILNKHTSDEYVNIVPIVTKCSLDVICETILGVEMHTQTDPNSSYLEAITVLTNALHERVLNPLLWPEFFFRLTSLGKQFRQKLKLVHDFTYKLIKERKKKIQANSDDFLKDEDGETEDNDIRIKKSRAFLDLLVYEHVINNSLSEDDVREEVDTFTFEGHDTTSMAMNLSLYLIGLHPVIQEKIRQELDSIFQGQDRNATMDDLKEMKYLESVIKESLRLYPPVSFFGRTITEDLEFQGKVIPKGSTCTVLSYRLHRDPEVFPNPEKFDPGRFSPENCIGRHPFAYVPFSAGPRNCIGQRFAMMELKVTLSSILRKYTIRSLDPRDKVQLTSQIVLRPYGGLRMEIRPIDYKPEKTPTYFYHS